MINVSFQFQIHINPILVLPMFLLKTWRSTTFGVYGYLNFTKSGFLEHSKNFKPEDMQKRIEGKNCLVTGANSGIGYATAEGLAFRGATVYMVCRNKERGEAALSKIRSTTGNQNVHLEVCDLSSVTEIKSFASSFASKGLPVHVLVALTEKWAETYKDKGISFYSMHPGWAATPGVAKSLPSFNKSLLGKLRTSEDGADTVIWLAFQPKERLVSGAFYFDRAEAPKHLKFAATGNSHKSMDSIISNLQSLCRLSSPIRTIQMPNETVS